MRVAFTSIIFFIVLLHCYDHDWVINRTARFLAFSLIIECTTAKVLQSIMPHKSIYNRNVGFIEQKMYFWMLQRVSSKKICINWHYFCHEKNFNWPLQSCPLYAYVITTQRCAVPLRSWSWKSLAQKKFYKNRDCIGALVGWWNSNFVLSSLVCSKS